MGNHFEDTFTRILFVIMIIFLSVFVILLFLIVSAYIKFSASVAKTEIVYIPGTITETKYEPEINDLNPMFLSLGYAVPMTRHFPEEKWVTVTAEGICKTFEDKYIYDYYNIGDTITLVVERNLDKEGNILSQKIIIPD